MSHGPPEVPIHLVPPLGGLLSTRGGHGKGLQPCFTIREDFTDRRTVKHRHFQSFSAGPEAAPSLAVWAGGPHCSPLSLSVRLRHPHWHWECRRHAHTRGGSAPTVCSMGASLFHGDTPSRIFFRP